MFIISVSASTKTFKKWLLNIFQIKTQIPSIVLCCNRVDFSQFLVIRLSQQQTIFFGFLLPCITLGRSHQVINRYYILHVVLDKTLLLQWYREFSRFLQSYIKVYTRTIHHSNHSHSGNFSWVEFSGQ